MRNRLLLIKPSLVLQITKGRIAFLGLGAIFLPRKFCVQTLCEVILRFSIAKMLGVVTNAWQGEDKGTQINFVLSVYFVAFCFVMW